MALNFHDFMRDRESEELDAASAFFELANARKVKYKTQTGRFMEITQDPAIVDCSGGIVWETSFLLAMYLEEHLKMPKSGCLRVLEVGSGCGLLGLSLAHRGCDVVLSEQPQALPNLTRNVKANSKGLDPAPTVKQLRWDSEEDRIALSSEPFDLIVGTDVVFAERLVEPLLATMHQLASSETTVWLCLQQRDADAHRELMATVPLYFQVEDLSTSLRDVRGCDFADELECILLKLSAKVDRSGSKKKKKRGDKKREQDSDNESEGGRKKTKKAKKTKKICEASDDSASDTEAKKSRTICRECDDSGSDVGHKAAKKDRKAKKKEKKKNRSRDEDSDSDSDSKRHSRKARKAKKDREASDDSDNDEGQEEVKKARKSRKDKKKAKREREDSPEPKAKKARKHEANEH